MIVDDHESFRSFAKSLLTADGFEVTGEADDGESALEEVARVHPDVVLLDVQLGDGIDGFEVARRLAEHPQAPVVDPHLEPRGVRLRDAAYRISGQRLHLQA